MLIRNSRNRISAELETGARVFTRLIGEHTEQLAVSTRLLSGDFAFKRAYATGDGDTVLSALMNHRDRIRANAMVLVASSGIVAADTMHPGAAGKPFSFQGLLDFAKENGGAASIVYIDGKAYQMAIVPLLAPEPVAWICAAFAIDDDMARDLQKITLAEVTFMKRREGGGREIIATTLPGGDRARVLAALSGADWQTKKSFSLDLPGGERVSLVIPFGKKAGFSMDVILMRSLAGEMKVYNRLRLALLALFTAGLAGTTIGAVMIARTVTRPVNELVLGVRKIESGDFGHTVSIVKHDEVGELAAAFNKMTRGLAERDRIRNLLGMVISPEIAEELMKKDVELGGEEREVTVLFADIRNFTAHSERRAPAQVLDMLNTYLTRMSGIIEANGGVIDKYAGDEIMALFGAPLSRGDDARRAMTSASQMIAALPALNRELTSRGLPELNIGIGINTSVVIAGNVGSGTRLNYTVIGDGVNLASRLEGLTKTPEYNARIIVSDATAASAGPEHKLRYLGDVSVKGKTQTTKIYALD